LQNQSDLEDSGFISGFQEGKYRPGSLNISHVHCDTEGIGDDWSGAKMFETQLVSYVCAHEKHQPSHATKGQ
jgi:hypothetical protein